ncbi:unnamed protein product [Spirodela intermedia]|uniref:PLD phosphodiesterase domain-containing protein n=1 Tax=Spirodela intermedia TaxID=51605 RepID=A0A7I8JJB7_SPIIN|nr:unnamed protein product [Spirodela intermedia]CAA6670254.1 unnamed protein product [Spirodela intermedia]
MAAASNGGRVICVFFLSALLIPFSVLASSSSSSSHSSCKAWLVQSIPTDMPRLARVDGVLSTGDVLLWLAGNSSKSLDIIAQYWQLVAQPLNPRSGDYGYSEADMERFGADTGREVYKSLENAADRMVNIRIVQHSGVYPDYVDESSDLAAGKPNVQNVTLLLGDWWGSGIVHAKVWISDGRSVYIGSANNDWKSLTQVKEVGIYLTDCPSIVEKVTKYFNNLWSLSSLNSSAYTKTVWDEQWQAQRKVPCWSHFVDHKERCRSPLPHYIEVPHVAGYPFLSDPSMFHVPIETPGHNVSDYNMSDFKSSLSYLSFAPPELSFGRFQADEQGTVRISSMDWLGQSQYATQTIFWSSLSSAVSEVVFSKKATVRILVAYWAHFIENTDQYLKSLLYSNILCSSSKRNKCGGKVQIKYYAVPGFNATGPALKKGKATGNVYPGYTRVNHGKYAVSHERAHIGTSNLVWDYFYSTAGVSFGTYHPSLVSQLQRIFDADWNSPYAKNVQPLKAAS